MAKKLRPIGKAKGDAIADELRAYYSRGQEIEDYVETKGKVSNKELKSRFNVSQQQLSKTRAFARCYTEKGLEALCSARTPKTGAPLHWAHVIQLLVVSDNCKLRNSLQKKAIRDGWSVRRLQEEIRKARGAKPESGGRPFKLTTKDAAISDALRWSAEVERYLKALLEKADGEDDNKLLEIDKAMADQDKLRIREFADALQKIQATAGNVEARLRKIDRSQSSRTKR